MSRVESSSSRADFPLDSYDLRSTRLEDEFIGTRLDSNSIIFELNSTRARTSSVQIITFKLRCVFIVRYRLIDEKFCGSEDIMKPCSVQYSRIERFIVRYQYRLTTRDITPHRKTLKYFLTHNNEVLEPSKPFSDFRVTIYLVRWLVRVFLVGLHLC